VRCGEIREAAMMEEGRKLNGEFRRADPAERPAARPAA